MKSKLLLIGCAALMAAAWGNEVGLPKYEKTKEWWGLYKAKKEEIYARMKRYGINRQDMAALRRLEESPPPYSDPHIKILAENLLKPGEYYRFEMDEYIVTMLVPDARPSASWIYPYTKTRNPDEAMQEYMEQKNGSLPIASLGWENCMFLGCMNSRGDVSGVGVTYRILSAEEVEGKISTLERLQQWVREGQKRTIEQALAYRGKNPIVSNAELEANRVALEPEIVTINGRIWVRSAMNKFMDRNYRYQTTLSPGRMLQVLFSMPKGHDYNAQPDPATWPGSAKKAYANMEKMAASLRVSKIDDDGSPDPFVVERVEPAPLPVREPLPSGQ